jgi:hypothetical protein
LGQGAAYQPLSTLRLCRVRRDSAGNVSWLSVPDAGVVQQFNGTLDGTGLRGRVTWVGANTDVSVELQPLSAGDVAAPEVSGLYSNMKYHEREGDLTGQEVLVIGIGPHPKMLITLYEGTPQGPFAVESLRVVGDTLRAMFRAPDLEEFTYIRHTDALHTPDGTVLPRKAGLFEALRPKPQPPC